MNTFAWPALGRFSTVSRYGAPAKDTAPVGIGSTPVKLLHSFETFSHDPTVLNLLIEETGTGLVRQQMARETINRQLDVSGSGSATSASRRSCRP